MAKPKNWTVTVEPIKGGVAGLIGYGGYLNASGHKNHKNTTVHALYGDFHNLVGQTLKSALQVDEKNTQGGPRMKSLAMSYVFSLPPVFKPTPEQWKLVAKDVIKAVTAKLELPAEKWRDFIFTNFHDQKNPHFNLVLSKTFGGEIIEKADQKSLISLAKRVFTESMATHCDIHTDDYEIVRERPKTRSGRTPKWEYERQLALEAAAKNEEALAKIELQKEKVELAKKELATLLFNADAWVKAVKRKTINEEIYEQNIVNSYGVLSDMKVSAITQRIEQIRQSAEEQANKKINIKPK